MKTLESTCISISTGLCFGPPGACMRSAELWPSVVRSTWLPAVRAADRQRQRAEPLRSNTRFSATTNPSPKLTWSRRGDAEGTRWCTQKKAAGHRNPETRRGLSGSGQDQSHRSLLTRARRASTCSVSPDTFRLTLAARAFIGGGFMGAGRGGGRAGALGTAAWTQTSRRRPLRSAELAFIEARLKPSDLTRLPRFVWSAAPWKFHSVLDFSK